MSAQTPRILALETSTEWCSVALLQGTQAFVRHEKTGPQSSQRILPMVAEVLTEAGLALTGCTALAFGEGPGAFTGLRTACGVVQGLAFGADLPVLSVDTLMSCAEGLRQQRLPASLPDGYQVLVVLDARMDEVYWAQYQWQDATQRWMRQGAVHVTAPEQVVCADKVDAVVGNALAVYAGRIPLDTLQSTSLDAEILPHAQAVATIAQGQWARGEAIPAALAAPVYVRDKIALTTAERQEVAAAKAAQLENTHG